MHRSGCMNPARRGLPTEEPQNSNGLLTAQWRSLRYSNASFRDAAHITVHTRTNTGGFPLCVRLQHTYTNTHARIPAPAPVGLLAAATSTHRPGQPGPS